MYQSILGRCLRKIMKCLATFHVTSMALMFEKICRKEGLDVKIIPVPRQLSASCGLACSYPCDKEESIRHIIEKKKIDVASFHQIDET